MQWDYNRMLLDRSAEHVNGDDPKGRSLYLSFCPIESHMTCMKLAPLYLGNPEKLSRTKYTRKFFQ